MGEGIMRRRRGEAAGREEEDWGKGDRRDGEDREDREASVPRRCRGIREKAR
jgi:hypothetical protein